MVSKLSVHCGEFSIRYFEIDDYDDDEFEYNYMFKIFHDDGDYHILYKEINEKSSTSQIIPDYALYIDKLKCRFKLNRTENKIDIIFMEKCIFKIFYYCNKGNNKCILSSYLVNFNINNFDFLMNKIDSYIIENLDKKLIDKLKLKRNKIIVLNKDGILHRKIYQFLFLLYSRPYYNNILSKVVKSSESEFDIIKNLISKLKELYRYELDKKPKHIIDTDIIVTKSAKSKYTKIYKKSKIEDELEIIKKRPMYFDDKGKRYKGTNTFLIKGSTTSYDYDDTFSNLFESQIGDDEDFSKAFLDLSNFINRMDDKINIKVYLTLVKFEKGSKDYKLLNLIKYKTNGHEYEKIINWENEKGNELIDRKDVYKVYFEIDPESREIFNYDCNKLKCKLSFCEFNSVDNLNNLMKYLV